MKEEEKPLVDTTEAIKNKWGKQLYKLFAPGIEKLLGIKKLNRIYDEAKGDIEPHEFAENILKQLNVSYNIPEREVEALRKIEGPLVIVCNHPFGGIEALFLFIFLHKIRPDYKIMANYMLQKIKEIEDKLILVDPFDSELSSQNNLKGIKEALGYLRNNGLLGIFPSGEVASFKFSKGKVTEPDWNPNIAKIIQKTNATVVPVYFHGRNSILFQMASAINPILRTSLLVRALTNPNVKKIHFQVGLPITPAKLKTIEDPKQVAEYLTSKTYLLGDIYRKSKFSFALIPQIQSLPEDEKIIDEIETVKLEKEIQSLIPSQLLYQQTDFQVLYFEAHQAPNLLNEIGRLREITFRKREVGEGTGKSIDIDEFDDWYYHILIWHSANKQIVGAYRLGRADVIYPQKGKKGLYTASLFKIKNKLFEQINPALEMGRSFVPKEYQRHFAPLMLLWTGIGHFVVKFPQYKYLFGPVSISGDFTPTAKDLMVHFLTEKMKDEQLEPLVKPRNKYELTRNMKFYNSLCIRDLKDVQDLVSEVEHSGLNVPILLKQYLKLGGKIIAFNVDPEFKDVLDGLILVNLTKTTPETLIKYMGKGLKSYAEYHKMELSDAIKEKLK